MRNTTVNVGPLLVTLAVVFTTYFGAAFAVPAMPASIQQALVSVPACFFSMKGNRHETPGPRAGLSLAHVHRVG
jgi:hypothetical protein